MRWSVKRRGGGRFDAKGTETLEERINVTGVGDGEGALGEVVADGGAEEFVGDRVDLDMVEGRQGRDEIVEVGEIGVLDTEIVNDEDKGYRAGKVVERSGRLDKARLKQK